MDEPFLPKPDTAESRLDIKPSPEISPIASSSSSSYANLIANLNKNKTKRLLNLRSNSAPSVFTAAKERLNPDSLHVPDFPSDQNTALIRQALFGVALYFCIGITTFLVSGGYKGQATAIKPIDALYYVVVTLCTIGYGDIVPDSTFTKLFTCFFILLGFGFVDVVLNGLVLHVCDRHEAVWLSAVADHGSRFNSVVETYVVDKDKGRMRIRTKAVMASGVVLVCVAAGTVAARFFERLSWVDSFYLSVTSVTTVGYGDYSFTTVAGRGFAAVWLLLSTVAVARAFLYLAELRIDKRNRRTAKWVLQKKVTLCDLLAADLDNDGSISKSEFVIYKLREMRKVAESDIVQICKQFDLLQHNTFGKITVADILER